MSHEAKYFTKDGIELDRETWLREYAAELAFAVGGDGPTKITPATDEQIAYLAENAELEFGVGLCANWVHGLIARIKAEREQTIRECAALADKLNKDFLSSGYASIQPSGSFLERFAVDEYRIAILSLLGDAPVDNGESSQ